VHYAWLAGEYVYHYSRALQEGEDPRYLKVVSTAKHFSGYDMESSDGTLHNHAPDHTRHLIPRGNEYVLLQAPTATNSMRL
jgi:beta-glucosidase-like glycosyl hydrolase